GHVVHKEVDQYRSPPHQAHIIALIGALQTALEIFDGCVTELYPDAHGCILRWGYWQVFFERYTRVLSEASPEFPIHFLKIYSCPPFPPAAGRLCARDGVARAAEAADPACPAHHLDAHCGPAARALCHGRPALGRSVHPGVSQSPGRSRPYC